MADIKTSGYKVAVQSIVWTSGQALNSLTDNEFTDLSDEIDNSSDNYLLVDLFLELASAAFTGDDSVIVAYLVPSVDGTKYPNWTGNVATEEQENEHHYVGDVPTSGATETQDLVIRNILLTPGKYKLAFRNKGGVTLAASGNTGEWRPHNGQVV